MKLFEDIFDQIDTSDIKPDDRMPDNITQHRNARFSIRFDLDKNINNDKAERTEEIYKHHNRLIYVFNNCAFVESFDYDIKVICSFQNGTDPSQREFYNEFTKSQVESIFSMKGTQFKIYYEIDITLHDVPYSLFCKDMRKIFMSTGKTEIFREYFITTYELDKYEAHSKDMHMYILPCYDSKLMWSQTSLTYVYKMFFNREPKQYDDETYRKRFPNRYQGVHFLLYLYQLDTNPNLFKNYTVDVYGVGHVVKDKEQTSTIEAVFLTIVPGNDEANTTGNIVDFIYKKIICAFTKSDYEHFDHKDFKNLRIIFFVYTNKDAVPTESKYLKETIDPKNGHPAIVFTDKHHPALTFMIEFVGENWMTTAYPPASNICAEVEQHKGWWEQQKCKISKKLYEDK